MYHSITFKYMDSNNTVIEEYNTWTKWHLIPSTRPVFVQPTPTYTYVDIPGKNGSLDLTDFLTGNGKPFYSDRQGSFEFYVDNWAYEADETWATIRQSLANFFDGREMQAILEDDPRYYYKGRFYFKTWSPDSNFSKVTIEYRVKPYRYGVSTGREVDL